MSSAASRHLSVLVQPTLWSLQDLGGTCISSVLPIGVIAVRIHSIVVVRSATTIRVTGHVHTVWLVASGVTVMSIATTTRVWTRATMEAAASTSASAMLTLMAVVLVLSASHSDIAKYHTTQLGLKVFGVNWSWIHAD